MLNTESGRGVGKKYADSIINYFFYIFGKKYEGPTGSIFGKLTDPTTFEIHFRPEKSQIFETPTPQDLSQLETPSTDDLRTRTIYILRGVIDMEDLAIRMQTERRFSRLQRIAGVTNATMATFAVRHVGFDIDRSRYDQEDTEKVLREAKQAEQRLLFKEDQPLDAQGRIDYKQKTVGIETTKENLIVTADAVIKLRRQLEKRVNQETSRRLQKN